MIRSSHAPCSGFISTGVGTDKGPKIILNDGRIPAQRNKSAKGLLIGQRHAERAYQIRR